MTHDTLTPAMLAQVLNCDLAQAEAEIHVMPLPPTRKEILRWYAPLGWLLYLHHGDIDRAWDEIGIPLGWPLTSESTLRYVSTDPEPAARKPSRTIHPSTSYEDYLAKHQIAPPPGRRTA